jgi:hypothetical protein
MLGNPFSQFMQYSIMHLWIFDDSTSAIYFSFSGLELRLHKRYYPCSLDKKWYQGR